MFGGDVDRWLTDVATVALLATGVWALAVVATTRLRASTPLAGGGRAVAGLLLGGLVVGGGLPVMAGGDLDGLPLPERVAGRARPAASTQVLTVRQGDSLWSISERRLSRPSVARVDAAWRLLHRTNRRVIGPDPDLIHPGLRLRLTRRERS